MDLVAAEREDPSKVSEDAILDSLFYACDTENLGQVSASRLIEYLRNAISNGTEEFAGNLDDLSLILDPEGKDMAVDLNSFQEGIKEWISDIRRRSFVNGEDNNFHSPVAVNCMESPQSTYSSHKRSRVTSTPNVSSESVEGLGGESPEKDWDRANELISTIEDLQLNNKRLMEQQNALEVQMETTEEANSQLNGEVERLQKQLRNYQLIIEKSREKDKENAELRQAVAEALEANQHLLTRISQLEKERALCESNMNEIHDKLLESQAELELLEEERRRLVQELADQKQYCSELKEIQGARDDMIAKESSSKSSFIADLSSANEALKMEKRRLESVVSELEADLVRVKKSELAEENRQLVDNGPILCSTPFSRQSSLQQELQDQESLATKGLPSPMVGNQLHLDDSLDVDDVNHSWCSTTSLDSTNTTLAFEKYSITAAQLANEFNEKKEKALRQIDELGISDRSPEIKDKREMLREQLTEDMDNFTDKISSLCVKKRAAEKRASKLLATIKKLKEENKELFEERSKAFQKLASLSISNDEINSRLSDLDVRLEQERRYVAGKDDQLKLLEDQLSATTQDMLAIRKEKDSLSRLLESQKQLISFLEAEISKLRKSQDEMEGLQTISLGRIQELECELLKVTTSLNVEKRRTSALEESIQLSVSKHSGELKEIFDTIPCTDSEVLERSRQQSPRTSSPCVTGHMVKSRLCDYIAQSDTIRRVQGVGRDSPDGKPGGEFQDKLPQAHDNITQDQQREELNQTPSEHWLDNESYKFSTSSISSDSLSPTILDKSPERGVSEQHDRQQIADSLDSPSGKFLSGLEKLDAETQPLSSQMELNNFLVSASSQTDFVMEIRKEESVADKATMTDEGTKVRQGEERRRKSGILTPPAFQDRKVETDKVGPVTDSDSNKLTVVPEKEKSATHLWRKKLSVAFKIPEEFDSYNSATSMALENAVENKHFVDGVSLRVRPAPNEKEIEKQFKTLVLAFQTDQDTIARRLEVQAHARHMAESNMKKELQRTTDMLKDFDALCITKDMQEMLSVVKSQVELLTKSSRRLTSQSEQHGCVQQESRMSSGIEVMICHAENLSRHLEKVQEDLTELRLRERLVTDELSTSESLESGTTNLDPQSRMVQTYAEPKTEADSTRQNSLYNFVMAFHTTSMRAKDALRKFRLRAEANRKERDAFDSKQPPTSEPENLQSESNVEESLEESGTGKPLVVVHEAVDNKVEETETVLETVEKNQTSVDFIQEPELRTQDKNSSPTGLGSEEVGSEEKLSQQMSKKPGVCKRCFLAVFRFTIFIIVFATVLFIGIAVMNKDMHVRVDRQLVLSKIHEYLDPVGQLIYYFNPPL